MCLIILLLSNMINTAFIIPSIINILVGCASIIITNISNDITQQVYIYLIFVGIINVVLYSLIIVSISYKPTSYIFTPLIILFWGNLILFNLIGSLKILRTHRFDCSYNSTIISNVVIFNVISGCYNIMYVPIFLKL